MIAADQPVDRVPPDRGEVANSCYISSTGKYGSHIGFPGARDVIAAQVLGPGDNE
jgi:hypothetical protein